MQRDPYESVMAGETFAAEAWLEENPRDPRVPAVSAALALADPQRFASPAWDFLSTFTEGEEGRTWVARACAVNARRSLLALDVESGRRWLQIATDHAAAPSLVPELGVERAHLAFLCGERSPVELGTLSRELRESQAPAVGGAVIDAVSIRALSELAGGDVEAALASARRASRMARTETLPQSEYLANVALARVRRARGHPHLTTRIGRALGAVASPVWSGWLGWELALSGSPRSAHMLLRKRAVHAGAMGGLAQALVGVFRCAPNEVGAALEHVGEAARIAPPLSLDIERLRDAVDPHADVGDDDLGEWTRGAATVAPWGLHAVTRDEVAEAATVNGYVVFEPSAPTGRRVLPLGLMLTDGAALVESDGGPKVGVALAELALAGEEGLDASDLFRRVYEQRFAPAQHRTMLKVLLHRARQALDDAAELERVGERLSLRATRPLAVADPRCERPLEDRVLHVLAQHGHLSAREAAKRLGVPLRTVQLALKTLLEEESGLEQQRDGRNVRYTIEDTTFSEPTRA